MGGKHTRNEKEIDLKAAKQTRHTLNDHISMLIKSVGIGEDLDHGERMRESMICNDEAVAPIFIMI